MTHCVQEIEALAGAGDWAAAVARSEQYCRDNPDDARAYQVLGSVLLQAGRIPDARKAFEHMLRLKPDCVDALLGLCTVWHALEHPERVITCLQQAITIRPSAAELHYNLALVLESAGLLDDAYDSCQACLSLSPGHIPATALQAVILGRRRCYQQAMDLIDPLLQRGVSHPRLVDAFVSLCYKVGRCGEAVALSGAVAADPGISQQDRMCLYFSTGHALDRMGRYDEAFGQFMRANQLRGVVQDVHSLQRHVDEIISVHGEDPARKDVTSDNDVPRIVFIIGMPRSGTTLVEQVLASHPDVYAAGELRGMLDIANTAGELTGAGNNYPHCMRELDNKQIAQLRQIYLSGLPDASQGVPVVTDKQPGNFLTLGLIRALFPEAAVIHTIRDPRDTCVSCYFHNFTGLAYTYDLVALGKTWRAYQQLMQHWQAVNIPMLQVAYEAMVENIEVQSRLIVEYCGLPWSEACLRFHEYDRAVATVSHDQVNQPIYRSSVGRWRHYRQYLEPLLGALQYDGPDQAGTVET